MWCLRLKDNLKDDDGEEEEDDDDGYYDENHADGGSCSLTSAPKGRKTGRRAGWQASRQGALGDHQLSVGVITCQSVYLTQQAQPTDRTTVL